MKILFVSNLYPPNVVGGYERLAFHVAEALSKRGHQIEVLTSDYGSEARSYPGQRIHRDVTLLADRSNIYAAFDKNESERHGINSSNIEAFRRSVDDFSPDIIFVWNLFFLDRSLLSFIESCGVPSVLFLTDNWLAVAETPDRVGGFFDRFVRGGEEFSASIDLTAGEGRRSIASAAIFGADFVRNFYAACGYDFENAWVVHNGVHMPPSSSSRPPARGQRKDPSRLKLLFAGRLVDLKAPDLCIRALPYVRDLLGTEVELELTIVGDGQDVGYRARLEQLILDDDSGADIRIAPAVAEAELEGLWASHDIYLFPSSYEPFALTLILALAAGIPTIASRAGGNEEIVFEGRTGLTFRSGDAKDMARQIALLALDDALAETLSVRGQRLARKFTFDRMMQQIEGILGELSASRGASALEEVPPPSSARRREGADPSR